jgi:predicted Zn-dependent protease
MLSSLAAGMIALSTPSLAMDNLSEAAWQESDKQKEQHAADIKRDVELGQKYVVEAEKELKLSQNPEKIALIQRIGGELGAIANKTNAVVTWGDKRLNTFDYSFKLVEDSDVNAFSLPGGFIYVNEGLVDYAESEDELAGVLAHEIAHASFRHVATLQREASRLSNITMPLVILAIVLGGMQAGGEMATVGSLIGQAKGSGWSVQAEEAADFGGFQYILKTKYRPAGMLTFMERMARDERNRPNIDWGILRTHPPGRERANALTEYMRDAAIPIRRSEVATSFRATGIVKTDGTVDVRFGDKHIVLLAGPDATDRSERVVEQLNSFFDSMPELYDLSEGDNGALLGRRLPLLTVTSLDAKAANMKQDDLQDVTLKNLKAATYGLAYRVWDVR